MVVDPWGLVIAQASDAPQVLQATLDFSLVERVRRQVPSLANRRPERYAWPEVVNV